MVNGFVVVLFVLFLVVGFWVVLLVVLVIGLVCVLIVGWFLLVGLVVFDVFDFVGVCVLVVDGVGCVDGVLVMFFVVWDVGVFVGFWFFLL